MLRISYILLISAVLGACHINSDQKRALADVQAQDISFIYDKKSGLCFTVSKITKDSYSYSYISCSLIPKSLIPNYPNNVPSSKHEESCRFESVLQHQNYTKT